MFALHGVWNTFDVQLFCDGSLITFLDYMVIGRSYQGEGNPTIGKANGIREQLVFDLPEKMKGSWSLQIVAGGNNNHDAKLKIYNAYLE